jgi:hypothetical protein
VISRFHVLIKNANTTIGAMIYHEAVKKTSMTFIYSNNLKNIPYITTGV